MNYTHSLQEYSLHSFSYGLQEDYKKMIGDKEQVELLDYLAHQYGYLFSMYD